MDKEFFTFHKELTITDKADVVVIGGGTAGVFAAISSGMQGAKTILIEKNGKLGGTITCGGVNFPGLFHAWGEQIIAGPCWESVKRAVAIDHTRLPDFSKIPEHHWQQQIRLNIFSYSLVLDQMCAEAGVDVRLHTMLAFAQETDDGVYVVCVSKEGLWAVKTKFIIDATGDANVVGILGYARIRSESLQPAMLIHHISGYDISKIDEKMVKERVAKAVEAGILAEKDMQGGNIYHHLAINRLMMHITDIDASTSCGKTTAEIAGRKTLAKMIEFLRSIPGLENLRVDYFAEECGIRETYRIIGETTITADEYLSGYVYEDAVCYAFYPIDLHVPNGIKQVFLEKGIVPTIPYGALIPKGSKRLLAAGRCISGDTDANSAYRVQAPCMAMGQAAGVAAAICARENISSVKEAPFRLLCDKLKEIGAIVPVPV